MAASGHERLFFAIWPDAAARAKLERLANEVAEVTGGRPTPAEKLHLTLVFLGAVESGRIAELHQVAREVRGEAFDLALDRLGQFRRAKVAWAGSEEVPAALIHLQAVLSAALEAGGFELEARAYSPHLTLARKIERPMAGARNPPIAWRAGEFTLVRSEAGGQRYVRIGTWPLG